MRRSNGFLGATAPIGGWNTVSRTLNDRTDDERTRHGGQSALGEYSQDLVHSDTRFSVFTDGRSRIGKQFSGAFNLLRQKATGAASGPNSIPVEALCPKDTKQPKLQNELTKQAEENRVRDITGRFSQLRPGDSGGLHSKTA